MYILFKAVDDKARGPIQLIGRWLNYAVGYIPDTHVDIIKYDHLNPMVIDENVAYAWKFANVSNGAISVRDGSLQNDQLQVVSSAEEPGFKVKYSLTDDDFANVTLFMKSLMRKMLDEVYDARFVSINANASVLETTTWAKQRSEAESWTADNTASTPTLDILAQARGIDTSTMVGLVLDAANAYDTKVATLLANKQIMEEAIRSCQNIEDCWVILHTKFGTNMPISLQQELDMMDVGTEFNI